MAPRTVITGTGVLSPVGKGAEAFWSALLDEGRRAGAGSPGAIEGFDLGDRRFRRAADSTRFAIASAAEAIGAAGLEGDEALGSAGLVVGITHGALAMSCDFHRGLVEDGPLGASPAFFSDSVLNAATGSVSLAFGLRGAAHTLIGGSPVGPRALALATKMVAEGTAPVAAAAATEAISERATEVYSKLGVVSLDGTARHGGAASFPGEGAATLLVETLDHARSRGADPVAEVAGWGFTTSGPLERSLARSIEKAFSASGVEPSRVGGVFVCAGPDGDEVAGLLGGVIEGTAPVFQVERAVGQGFCASSLTAVVAAAMAARDGVMPPTPGVPGGPVKTVGDAVLVVTTGLLGETGCIVIRRV